MQFVIGSLLLILIAASGIAQTAADMCPFSPDVCYCFADAVVCVNLTSMPQLTQNFSIVNFINGSITNISKDDVPAGLRYLTLYGHPITSISDDAFDNSATTLEFVRIDRALFRQLPRALFQLTNLTTLEISETRIDIETFNVSILTPKLTSLTLRNVGLLQWPSWMSYFHSLSAIDFRDNSLTTIPDNAFSSFNGSLTFLYLDNTNLTHLPTALSSLSALSELDLSGNSFADVNELETVFPPNLAELVIKSIGLTTILNFTNIAQLKEINLDNNNISDLNAGSFPPSVVTLHLAGNNLPAVPAVVANMSSLSEMDLSKNQISEIQPHSFPPQLIILQLELNQITEIKPGCLPSSLSYLNLESNQIKEIHVNSFPTTLTELYLSNNHITEISPYSFPPSLQSIDLSNNKLSDITNTTFTNLTRLRGLELNNNPISTISTSAFTDLESLRNLNLDFTNLTEVPLALADLRNYMHVFMKNISSLSCHCPVPRQLALWRYYGGFIEGSCREGFLISDYLSFTCATDALTTTPRGNVPALRFSTLAVCCAISASIFIFFFRYVIIHSDFTLKTG